MDPSIGRLKFVRKSWSEADGGRLVFEEVPTEPCNVEFFNDANGGEDSPFFELTEHSRSNA